LERTPVSRRQVPLCVAPWGTRISVDLVLELLASGWHDSTILKEYPGLKRQDILACIRYAQEIVRSERVYSTTAHG